MSNGSVGDSDMDGRLPSCPGGEEGERFPLGMTLQVLGAALLVFTVIPYIGITTPPSPRTDLGWWRDGLLVDGVASISELEKFRDQGYVGVRLPFPHRAGPDVINQRLISDIRQTGMKVIVTLAVEEDKQGLYQPLQTAVREWLEVGVDGISLAIHPFFPISDIQNMTARVQASMWHHHNETAGYRKSLLMVETPEADIQQAALDGGADMVVGSSLCSPLHALSISEQIERAVTMVQERGDTQSNAWTVCESAQSDPLLSQLSMLLPGAPLSPSSGAVPVQYLSTIRELRTWPALHWGTLELVRVDADLQLLSYLVWAKGRLYDKVAVVINFSPSPIAPSSFVRKLDKFSVPGKGRVVLGDRERLGQVVDMTSLSLNPREMLVIQFPAMGI